ncbi:MAG: chromate efflux transporter [Planctomycetes bacterium]|nr:chromate efflux transporter [Planctomycetota bacterium]
MTDAAPPPPPPSPEPPPRAAALRELAILFLRLGTVAFGGPAAHIAMMEDEVVRRRGWLGREKFLDLLAATNLIPGPNSTEMAIHIGHQRAGWPGLLVAGASFIIPASMLTLLVAWLYVEFGTLPAAEGFLYGVKATILAVVLQALWRLGRSAVKSVPLGIVGALAIVANALGVHELAVLAGGGVWVAVGRAASRRSQQPPEATPAASFFPLPLPFGQLAAGTVALAAPFSLSQLFLLFLKTGAVLFGSGYVLLAFMRADLVDRLHWLTEQQLLDAIAAGQITPGPVFTTATFVGYLLGGVPGATLATLGIFLPAFFFVAVSGPIIPRLRRSPTAAAFLDGVIVASLSLMAVVTVQLGQSAIVDLPSAALVAASAVLLFRFQLNSAWLVLGGGAAGMALQAGLIFGP